MKKILSLMMTFVMLVSLAACGGEAAQGDASTSAAPEGPKDRVVMITDSGDIDDGSFNQTAFEVCKAYCEENGVEFAYKKPAEDTLDSRNEMIDAAVKEGFSIVILPGSQFGGSVVECTPKYPDVKFVALSLREEDILKAALGKEYDAKQEYDVTQYYNAENTWCVNYQEEIAGYLAGYTAVRLGYTRLGFLGGKKVPAVQRYGYGFVQGVNDAAEKLGIPKRVSMQFIYGGRFSGSSEITDVMNKWYENGTEVVFACGGGIYTSAAEAAARNGGKVIGVDIDQQPVIDQYGESMTVTSAMKNLDATVRMMLDDILVDGTWEEHAGQIDTLGLVSGDDLSLNYVQLADSTQWSDIFTEDDYHTLVSAMFAGEITVSDDVSAAPKTSIKVKYHKNSIT